MSEKIVASFLSALDEGLACLHPTDTIPGLGFNPNLSKGADFINRFKERGEGKNFIGLVASLEKTQKFWQPLPDNWLAALKRLWPGSLSVIWRASDGAPSILTSQAGLIALRMPEFQVGVSWMKQVLEELPYPLPTTSVNKSSEESAMNWLQAIALVRNAEGLYIPDVAIDDDIFDHAKASTIIELKADGSFKSHREGAVSLEKIHKALEGGP